MYTGVRTRTRSGLQPVSSRDVMSRALAEAPFSISPLGENTTNLLGNEAHGTTRCRVGCVIHCLFSLISHHLYDLPSQDI